MFVLKSLFGRVWSKPNAVAQYEFTAQGRIQCASFIDTTYISVSRRRSQHKGTCSDQNGTVVSLTQKHAYWRSGVHVGHLLHLQHVVAQARPYSFNSAMATIRRVEGVEFHFELVITRVYEEGEAQILDEDEESGSIDPYFPKLSRLLQSYARYSRR